MDRWDRQGQTGTDRNRWGQAWTKRDKKGLSLLVSEKIRNKASKYRTGTKQGQEGTTQQKKAGTNQTGTKQGQGGIIEDLIFRLSGHDCHCFSLLSLFVPAVPVLSLIVPVLSLLSLFYPCCPCFVPACPCFAPACPYLSLFCLWS